MKRLLLVRHAPTAATRAAAFPGDEPIEPAAAATAALLAGLVPRAAGAGGDGAGGAETGGAEAGGAGAGAGAGGAEARAEVLASPALRCAQTAAAAGLTPRVEPRIAECDFGAWSGRSLAELHGDDPDAVGRWMTDPDAAPHGGESLRAFVARVGGWLDEQAAGDGATLAITHGGVVKAAIVHALGAPPEAFWRVDVAPLTVTELHAHDGRWTITRTNCPIEQAGTRPGRVGGAAGAKRSSTDASTGAAGANSGAADANAGAAGADGGAAVAETTA